MGHRGVGEGREPGPGAVDHGAQDAVQRHGAPHPGAHPPPRQGLGEARARPQGAHAARPLPGTRQEAPRDPHQEDQVSATPSPPVLTPFIPVSCCLRVLAGYFFDPTSSRRLCRCEESGWLLLVLARRSTK